MTKQGMTVDVKVGVQLKQFITNMEGDSLIVLKQQSYLARKLQMFLQLVPKNYKPVIDDSEFIKINLPWRFGSMQIHTVYRNYLDEYGQLLVRSYYYDIFKGKLHEHIIARQGLSTIEASIYHFAETWGIRITDQEFEALKKSWYRSRERKKCMAKVVPTIVR